MKLLYFFLGFIFLGFFVFYPVKKDGKLLSGRISGKIIAALGMLTYGIDTIFKLDGVFFFFFAGIELLLAGTISDLVDNYIKGVNKLKSRIIITSLFIILERIIFFTANMKYYIYYLLGLGLLECVLFIIF